MKIECRPKYFENSFIIRDYILIFTFNGQRFVSSYHDKIINQLVKKPNFNLMFYLSIKLGLYLKELHLFVLSTRDGDDKVYIPLDYCEEWKFLKHVFSIFNISLDFLREMKLDFSHPDAIKNTQIKPSGTDNRIGFFLKSRITNRTENRHYNGICTIYNQISSDKKTIGHHYNKEYTFDWNDDCIFFKNLMEKISSISNYIENVDDKYTLTDDEILIIKRGIETIFMNDIVTPSASTFLRGLFNEYKCGDQDHKVAMNHLKMLEMDPREFIDYLRRCSP